MRKSIQTFLENNVKYLSSDAPILFFRSLYNSPYFGVSDAAEVCIMLFQAGVNKQLLDSLREQCLIEILDINLKLFAKDDDGVSGFPIRDFINAYLDNRLGLTMKFIEDTMFNNAARWINIVDIYRDKNNIPLIRKRG